MMRALTHGVRAPSPRLRGEGRGEGCLSNAQTRGEPPSPAIRAHARMSTSQPKSDLSDFGQLKMPNSGKPEFGCTRGEVHRACGTVLV